MSSSTISFITLVLSAMLMQSASEIYAPSLPHMAEELGTTLNMTQMTLAIYMVGASLTQLIYGPLSDVYGRRPPLIFGVLIFLVGTFICLSANSIETLLLGRFVQGIGAGAPAGLWRTIFRDLYHGPELAKYASYLTIIISLVFPLSPALGGFFESNFGWKASFLFIAVYTGILIMLLVFKFEETNRTLRTTGMSLKSVACGYLELLKTPLFIGSTGLTFLAYGTMFSSVATTPILFIELMDTNPLEFGWIICLTATIGMSNAGWINGRLVGRFGVNTMLRLGFGIMCFVGVLMGGAYLLVGFHKITMILSLALLYFGIGFIFSNAFAKAFTPLKKNIGFAGALYGFIQMSGGAVLGMITSYLPDTSPLPLAVMIIVCSCAGWGLVGFLKRVEQ